jgi:hypothetical protein
MTETLTRQYGVQRDVTRDVFNGMTRDIDAWASGATASAQRVQQAMSASGGYNPPGRAEGGVVSGGGLYEVNEGGVPELLNVGGRTYLMMGSQSGMVIPSGDMAATARGVASAGAGAQSIMASEGAGGGTTNTRGGDTWNVTIATAATAPDVRREIGLLQAMQAGMA